MNTLNKESRDYLILLLDCQIIKSVKELDNFLEDKYNGTHRKDLYQAIKLEEIGKALRILINLYLINTTLIPIDIHDGQIEFFNIEENKIRYINKEDIPNKSIIRIVKENKFYFVIEKQGFEITDIILKYIKEIFAL